MECGVKGVKKKGLEGFDLGGFPDFVLGLNGNHVGGGRLSKGELLKIEVRFG